MSRTQISQAAEAIKRAEALVIGAGAGMGVDSGLPDFRGDEGFWRAYPPMKRLGLSFYDMADPRWFRDDPALAWGFYGHRLNLYRRTEPHEGFQLLLKLAAGRPIFVLTSNVDGAFGFAGFEAADILEFHGSIHHLQCHRPCSEAIWPIDAEVVVDPETFRATSSLPTCPRCGALARPNILMFGDYGWLSDRSDEQYLRWQRWRHQVGRIAVVEIGAGTAVPTVRRASERLALEGADLIRVNPRESHGPPGALGIAMGGLSALRAIAAA